MADKPILFSGPMVRAILEGNKTQTRRVIKPQPHVDEMGNAIWGNWNLGQNHEPHIKKILTIKKLRGIRCQPYGTPGSLLWVRETFAITHQSQGHEYPEVEVEDCDKIPKDCGGAYWKPCYQADWKRAESYEDRGFKWRPSIHMPRWTNRLTLDVKDIRVERLQDISSSDCIAEGICRTGSIVEPNRWAQYGAISKDQHDKVNVDIEFMGKSPKEAFELLWESINGAENWQANPWVWIISFTPHQCNIDDYLKERAA